MRELITEVKTGVRVVNNTEWPVVDRIEIERIPGREDSYVATRGLCNGVPDDGLEFRTLGEAQLALDKPDLTADQIKHSCNYGDCGWCPRCTDGNCQCEACQ